MMAPTHALSGAVVFLAISVPLAEIVPTAPAMGAATVALGTVAAAGAALLPDLDHPNATAARAFGPITRLAGVAVRTISGGHRHGTHSLVGVAAFAFLSVAAVTAGGWALVALLALLIGLADRALLPRAKPRRDWRLTWGDVAGLAHAAAAVGVGYLLASNEAAAAADMAVLPWAVAIGAAAHIAGDALTEKGVRLFWPAPWRQRIGTIDTDSVVEKWVVVPALYGALAVIAYASRTAWMPTWMSTGLVQLAGG